MGGEKKSLRRRWVLMWGSPPHGRGKACKCPRCPWWPGITPAWAGKSSSASLSYWYARDHPRMGGEKVTHNTDRKSKAGSPPHGRGKARCILQQLRVVKDHPRMGGEKCEVRNCIIAVQGSPPHGRGKVGEFICDDIRRRITPAWAGKRSVMAQLMILP